MKRAGARAAALALAAARHRRRPDAARTRAHAGAARAHARAARAGPATLSITAQDVLGGKSPRRARRAARSRRAS